MRKVQLVGEISFRDLTKINIHVLLQLNKAGLSWDISLTADILGGKCNGSHVPRTPGLPPKEAGLQQSLTLHQIQEGLKFPRVSPPAFGWLAIGLQAAASKDEASRDQRE